MHLLALAVHNVNLHVFPLKSLPDFKKNIQLSRRHTESNTIKTIKLHFICKTKNEYSFIFFDNLKKFNSAIIIFIGGIFSKLFDNRPFHR